MDHSSGHFVVNRKRSQVRGKKSTIMHISLFIFQLTTTDEEGILDNVYWFRLNKGEKSYKITSSCVCHCYDTVSHVLGHVYNPRALPTQAARDDKHDDLFYGTGQDGKPR